MEEHKIIFGLPFFHLGKHSGTLALNLEDITTGFAHLFGGVVNYHVANDTAEAPVQSVPYSGLLKPPTFIPILRKAGQGVQKNAAGSPSTRGTVQIVQFASLIETTPSRIINAPAVNVTNSSTVGSLILNTLSYVHTTAFLLAKTGTRQQSWKKRFGRAGTKNRLFLSRSIVA